MYYNSTIWSNPLPFERLHYIYMIVLPHHSSLIIFPWWSHSKIIKKNKFNFLLISTHVPNLEWSWYFPVYPKSKSIKSKGHSSHSVTKNIRNSRESSVVKSTSCFCRGLTLSSQHPHWTADNYILTPVSEDLKLWRFLENKKEFGGY